jgi:hypothetical protein
MTVHDVRANARSTLRQPLTFDYYAYDGQKLGSGFGVTLNVSEGGVMFETEIHLEILTPIVIEIISPIYAFMASGHVVHTNKSNEGHHILGVYFREVIQAPWNVAAEIA